MQDNWSTWDDIDPHVNDTVKQFEISIVVAWVATAVSILIAHLFGWTKVGDLSLMEVFATFVSYSCTYLCVKQKRCNYYMAVIATASLAYVFWNQGLYGSMALNLYLIPTVIYGWFIWGRDETTKPVQNISLYQSIPYIIATAITYAGALWIVKYFGGTMAPLDSIILIGSILAQWLLDRKKIATWKIWAFVNVVSIYVYFESGLYLLAIQFIVFLANTLYGHIEWSKTMKGTSVNAQ